jgi:2-iminoacetate synthase ThiH
VRRGRNMNLHGTLREKGLKTAIRAFPAMAALSPGLAQLSARAVTTNPKILSIMARKRATRRFGVSILRERPLLAQIHITSYCNHACQMCNIWKNPVMMDYEDAIRILDTAAEMGSVFARIFL